MESELETPGLDEHARQRIDSWSRETAATLRDRCFEAARAARIALAQELLRAVARIRAAEGVSGVAAALLEGASPFTSQASLLIHQEGRLVGFRDPAVLTEPEPDFSKCAFAAQDAASIRQTLETRKPGEARGVPEELSASFVGFFELTEADRIQLLPVILRDRVVAVLCCRDRASAEATLQPAVELLVEAAALSIERLAARRHLSAA